MPSALEPQPPPRSCQGCLGIAPTVLLGVVLDGFLSRLSPLGAVRWVEVGAVPESLSIVLNCVCSLW